MSQTIDLENFTTLIDSNLAEVHFEGYFGVMGTDQVIAALIFWMNGELTLDNMQSIGKMCRNLFFLLRHLCDFCADFFCSIGPITENDMQNQTDSLVLHSIDVPIPVKTRYIYIAV